MKFSLQEDDRHKQGYLTTSQAQQIGGRAGRFRTQFEDGEVTTFWPKDVKVLKNIVNTEKTPLEVSLKHVSLLPKIEEFMFRLIYSQS
jgi:ATP-dependent RNA helicase SUPV3L1/SUV3